MIQDLLPLFGDCYEVVGFLLATVTFAELHLAVSGLDDYASRSCLDSIATLSGA